MNHLKLFTVAMLLWQSQAFANAAGSFIVAAPTALNGPTNQGIWFVKNGGFSLNLPDLPSDQVYEGWLVDNCTGKKISIGLFRADGKIDSDSAGPFAGPLALNFPPVPGSDFVKVGSNLVDGSHTVVITIEPYPDMDANPSGHAVLRGNIPANASVGTEIVLESVMH